MYTIAFCIVPNYIYISCMCIYAYIAIYIHIYVYMKNIFIYIYIRMFECMYRHNVSRYNMVSDFSIQHLFCSVLFCSAQRL